MSSYPGLWPQLQELAFGCVSDKPSKILLRSLRASHRPTGLVDPELENTAAGEVLLPRSAFWRLFFGMVPLPPQIEHDEEENSPAAQKKTGGPRRVGGGSTASKKKGMFDSSSSSSSSSDSDNDKFKTAEQQAAAAKKHEAAAEKRQLILADYTEDQVRSAVDAARKEYGDWRTNKGASVPVASPTDSSGTQSPTPGAAGAKKTFFSSSSKKKNKPDSDGPRFGDDSSSSSSDDDGEAVAVVTAKSAATTIQRKNMFAADASSTSSGTDDDDGPAPSGVHDPLLHGDDPKWQKYFARKKEMELIDKDLNRLYFNDIEFFEDPMSRRMVRRMLEASLDLQVVTAYAQGMHEIAAMILYVLHIDAGKYSKCGSSSESHHHALTRHVFDPEFIEHDAFFIYTRVCKEFELARWFENTPPLSRPSITRIIEEVHGPRLSRANLPLHDHLCKYDIPVVTYGLRWLRLLFAREFSTGQALKLWDVAFAEFFVERKPVWQSVVPEIMLSMLLYIARELVDGDDHTGTLRRLMRFPPVEDITALYGNALERAYPRSSSFVMHELLQPPAPPQQQSTAASITSPTSSTQQAAAPQHQDAAAPGGGGGSSMFDTIASLVSGGSQAVKAAAAPATTPKFEAPPSQQQPASPAATGGGGGGGRHLPLQIQTMKNKQRRLGERLSKVIDRLNDKWFDDDKKTKKESDSEEDGGDENDDDKQQQPKKKPAATSDEQYLLAIAEIKRIRDELLGDI